MFKKKFILGSVGILLLAALGFAVGYIISDKRISNPGGALSANAILPLGSDKETDGLKGPVNRVMVESARLSLKSGRLVEGARELCELTTYNRQGKRVDNSYYLVASDAQAGREEYAYDEQGNLNEMTVRDQNNNIVSKEVYNYEYDAVGNWTKRVTSTAIYEGGQVKQQPTEVTHRNITYYLDQAIADIANSNSSTAENAGDEEHSRGDLETLRRAFDGWIAATNAQDVDHLIGFYNSKVETFYRAQNVSQDFVRDDKTRSFKRVSAIEVSATAPDIMMSGDNRTATMRFHKTYAVKMDGREHHGEVLEWLRWQRTDDGWKIVGERDLRVLRKD
jgi:YD repeat-containing protein